MLIPALVLAFIPVIAALFVNDFKLGKVQNAVEGKAVTGERVESGEVGLVDEPKA